MNQRGHDKYSRACFPWFIGGAVALSIATGAASADTVVYTATAAGWYWLGCYYLGPDLDMPNTSPTHRWGLLALLWRPYSVTHKHRGISHLPLWGSFERCLYLLTWAAIALVALKLCGYSVPVPAISALPWRLIGWAYFGLEAGCLLHLFCDYVVPRKLRK